MSRRWINLHQFKTKEILLKVVGQHTNTLVPSNKAGTFYKCICTIHKEKTASMKFYYNKDIDVWIFKCFGCGNSGDVFSFLMKTNHWDFWEALAYVKKSHLISREINTMQLELPFPSFSTENKEDDDLPF